MTSFLDFVVSEKSDALSTQAVNSFMKSLRYHGMDHVTREALEMWIVDMTLDSLKKTTRKRYFSKLSSIYRQWRSEPGDDPFDAVREAVELDYESAYHEALANLALVGSLLAKERDCADRELIDVFLYLLYNVDATVDDVVSLKVNDDIADNPQTHDLIDDVKTTAGNRTYMFGLSRNNKRTTQVKRELISELSRVLAQAGMRFDKGFSRDSITGIWMAAAIKAGIPFPDIKAMVPRVPPGYDSFSIISASKLNDRRRTAIQNRVADSINDRASRWFVMKLRSGHTPDDLRQSIDLTGKDAYGKILFYYPTRKEVKRDAKGKLVKKEVPYLPSIMFFRIRRDRVSRLMHSVGHAAWCYKETSAPGSPYCTISNEEMKNFQRHVGQFTPDIRMTLTPLGEPLGVGDKVVINGGGIVAGHIGEIQSVKNANGTRTYTLALSSHEGATWTVKDVEGIFIEPVK